MQEHTVFPPEAVEAVVAWHNVAGPDGVLCAASDDLISYLNNHYAARAVDHIPATGNGVRGFIYTEDPAGAAPQVTYRGQLAGQTLTPITHLSDLAAQGIKRALFLPYIRLIEPDHLPPEIDWMVYGLPAGVTQRMKNKADLHHWLLANDLERHTLNFVSCPISEILQHGRRMIEQIEALYEACGMTDVYPAGLMVRGALSDGNYGAGFLRRAIMDEDIHGQFARQGQIVFNKDGTVDPVTIYDTWEDALAGLRDHIDATTQAAIDNRVVMTRLLDLWVSPGMSGAVIDSTLHPFAFNGQYTEPGDSACSGTWTFQAAVGDAAAARVNERHLQTAHRVFRQITERFLADVAGPVYGMLNIDFMIVGGMEDELRQRAQENPEAHIWLNNQGRCNDEYTPRIYSPDTVLIAELNPRDTNWTLAMKAVLQAAGRPCTLEALHDMADGKGLRVLARDRWPLPEAVKGDKDVLREKSLAFHRHLADRGEGFILRMADDPAGVILYTPSTAPHRVQDMMREARAFFGG